MESDDLPAQPFRPLNLLHTLCGLVLIHLNIFYRSRSLWVVLARFHSVGHVCCRTHSIIVFHLWFMWRSCQSPTECWALVLVNHAIGPGKSSYVDWPSIYVWWDATQKSSNSRFKNIMNPVSGPVVMATRFQSNGLYLHELESQFGHLTTGHTPS